PGYGQVRSIVDDNQLHTVCESAHCPNLGECWSRGTATLMILGEVCTRTCSFCAVQSGKPPELDLGEPARVAEAVAKMNLKHCVLTSVARDDLRDGGAKVWANVIRAVRNRSPGVAIEVLTPDFQGDFASLDLVLDANPDIFNHNLETVERLQQPIRKTATYERTLSVLKHAQGRGFTTKSGIMLGIGERQDEIGQAIRSLREVGVQILTIGQYLQPTPSHAPIDRWAPPEEFEAWKEFALSIGIGVVESGPLVRSSYHAEEQSERFGIAEAASA
ncbi:MAG: lipoyl synthase, partial [Opitutales bacterium]